MAVSLTNGEEPILGHTGSVPTDMADVGGKKEELGCGVGSMEDVETAEGM